MGIKTRKPASEFVKNPDADQPAQLSSLISAFVIYLLKSNISSVTTFNVLASVCSCGDWFEAGTVRKPETG